MDQYSARLPVVKPHVFIQPVNTYQSESTKQRRWLGCKGTIAIHYASLDCTTQTFCKRKEKKKNKRREKMSREFRSKEKNNRKLSQSKRSGCYRLPSILWASAPDPRVCQRTTCHLLEKKIIQMQETRRWFKRKNPFAKSGSCAPSILNQSLTSDAKQRR